MTIVFLSAGFVFWWTSQARESIELLFLFLFLKIFFPNLIYGITTPPPPFIFWLRGRKKGEKTKKKIICIQVCIKVAILPLKKLFYLLYPLQYTKYPKFY